MPRRWKHDGKTEGRVVDELPFAPRSKFPQRFVHFHVVQISRWNGMSLRNLIQNEGSVKSLKLRVSLIHKRRDILNHRQSRSPTVSITDSLDHRQSRSPTVSITDSLNHRQSRSPTVSLTDSLDHRQSRSPTVSITDSLDNWQSRSPTVSIIHSLYLYIVSITDSLDYLVSITDCFDHR